MKRMTRRSFLKTTAASVLALMTAGGLSGCIIRINVRQARILLLRWLSTRDFFRGVSSHFSAEIGNKPSQPTFIFGTGGSSGTYYAIGKTLSDVLNEKLTLFRLQVTVTSASKVNIKLIESGEADLAIAQNDVMYYAASGIDLFEKDGSFDGFRTVCGVYSETCQFVCSADIKSFEDLKGKKVAVGEAGSSTELNAQQILAAYGLSYDDIEVQYGSIGSYSDLLIEGRVDAVFVTSSYPNMAVTDIASSRDINILTVDDEHAEILINQYPFYARSIIPAGTYKGLDEDIRTVAVKATLIASVNLSEEVVYELTQAIFDNLPALVEDQAKFGQLSPESAVDGLAVPLHPGAEAYFRDIGLEF